MLFVCGGQSECFIVSDKTIPTREWLCELPVYNEKGSVFVKLCHVVETLEQIEVPVISACTLRNNDMWSIGHIITPLKQISWFLQVSTNSLILPKSVINYLTYFISVWRLQLTYCGELRNTHDKMYLSLTTAKIYYYFASPVVLLCTK